jgi:hypothetical protein
MKPVSLPESYKRHGACDSMAACEHHTSSDEMINLADEYPPGMVVESRVESLRLRLRISCTGTLGLMKVPPLKHGDYNLLVANLKLCPLYTSIF